MDTITPKEREMFSVVKRAESFSHAWRGIVVFIKSTHNAWIHLTIFACAVIAGLYFHLNRYEWMALLFAAGLVLMAEAFNTAIEIDIDLTSPDFHPYARDTKDVAAGAVLIAAMTALVIGILIFAPHILQGSTL